LQKATRKRENYTMAKILSKVSGVTYNEERRILTVEVIHHPTADYSRSVRATAWRKAKVAFSDLPFTVRSVVSTLEPLDTWKLGQPMEGYPSTTLIHYRITG